MKPAPLSPDEISEVLARLARKHLLGAVGLAGRHAAGIARPYDRLEVLVVDELAHLDAFGEELSAEVSGSPVRLYCVRRLPWSHPLHLCVRWVNVDALFVVECPRGAITRAHVQTEKEGEMVEVQVLLETLAHFRAVDRIPPPPPRGERSRHYDGAPLGGFLI